MRCPHCGAIAFVWLPHEQTARDGKPLSDCPVYRCVNDHISLIPRIAEGR